jgi:hypothetical protein
MDNTPLPEGISFFGPRDNAPDFVLGTISINPAKFVDYLTNQSPDEKGYVKFQVLIAKGTGKPYVKLDTYKPPIRFDKDPVENPKGDEVRIEDVPF